MRPTPMVASLLRWTLAAAVVLAAFWFLHERERSAIQAEHLRAERPPAGASSAPTIISVHRGTFGGEPTVTVLWDTVPGATAYEVRTLDARGRPLTRFGYTIRHHDAHCLVGGGRLDPAGRERCRVVLRAPEDARTVEVRVVNGDASGALPLPIPSAPEATALRAPPPRR